MGGVCCCGSDESRKSSRGDKALFKEETSESNEIKGQLSKEEKIKKVMNNKQVQSFKAGQSSYAKANIKGRNSLENQTQELEALNTFLAKRPKNGYKVEKWIGSGNYAEVFKAYGLKEHKFVAIKVIDLRKTGDNYRINFLPKEVEILKKCKHTNIIKMFEIAQSGKRVYMIMEFAPNGTLSDWLKNKGAYSEPLAQVTYSQIMDAIHHMHSRGIAHRDLKLENIMLCNNYIPKISDFSYAVEVNQLKDGKSDQFCGSLPYFAPEILRRQPHNPLMADIWSLGVCFYIMLNDGLPFRLGNDKLMLEKQLNRDWKFRTKVEPKLSEELKSMIRSMLEPSVKKRATSAVLINHPWFGHK